MYSIGDKYNPTQLDFARCTSPTGSDINDFLDNLLDLIGTGGGGDSLTTRVSYDAITELGRLQRVLGDEVTSGVQNVFRPGNIIDLQISEGEVGVWELNIPFNFLSSGTEMFVSSSSASDTMSLVVFYLDGSYNQMTAVVTLSGTSTVSIDTDVIAVNFAFTQGGTNVGDLYIHTNVGGNTAGVPDDLTDVHEYVAAGKGLSRSQKYTVPLGHSLLDDTISFTASNENAPSGIRTLANIKVHVREPNGTTRNIIDLYAESGTFAAQERVKGPRISPTFALYFTVDTNEDGTNLNVTAYANLIRDDYIATPPATDTLLLL